jgi:CPA2 family monovalent cation:H+ antiporter-2
MHGDTQLIATIAISLAAAFAGGLIAARLGLPTIVGYLLAGVAVGPFTPGFVADPDLATQLAEIGVILLMFGVGMHFSLGDLLRVRGIAVPGALGQILVATLLGMGVAWAWGWSPGEGFVFGLSLSVASTVVLLRALDERGGVGTPEGRIAVGWLLVEDVVMVIALVALPGLAGALGGSAGAGGGSLALDLVLTLAKLVAFIALMLVVGRRIVPVLLGWAERLGANDLFVLAVLATALGIAYGAAEIFGVSVALGAFLAGVAVNGSDLSHRAAQHAIPLQEAFAVLFFVSVGMLIDPATLVDQWRAIVVVALVVVVGKSVAAFAIVALAGRPARTGLTVAAGLSQIGEFSFILAELGRSLGVMGREAEALVLAGALVSITLNPLMMRSIDPAVSWIERQPSLDRLARGRRGSGTIGPADGRHEGRSSR